MQLQIYNDHQLNLMEEGVRGEIHDNSHAYTSTELLGLIHTLSEIEDEQRRRLLGFRDGRETFAPTFFPE